jgi:multidrug efflux pump subunit AcrA (membrane-fusion protein)
VHVSELDVVQLRGGAPVDVTLDAYPEARIAANIRRVFPSADQQSRLVPVEVALGAVPSGVAVRPGFLARARFALDRREDALAVPAPAVGVERAGSAPASSGNGGSDTFVYVIDADSVIRRSVKLGVTAEGWVEITSGLREAEVVVTSGHTNLRPGARVRVTNAEGPVTPADQGSGR